MIKSLSLSLALSLSHTFTQTCINTYIHTYIHTNVFRYFQTLPKETIQLDSFQNVVLKCSCHKVITNISKMLIMEIGINMLDIAFLFEIGQFKLWLIVDTAIIFPEEQ